MTLQGCVWAWGTQGGEYSVHHSHAGSPGHGLTWTRGTVVPLFPQVLFWPSSADVLSTCYLSAGRTWRERGVCSSSIRHWTGFRCRRSNSLTIIHANGRGPSNVHWSPLPFLMLVYQYILGYRAINTLLISFETEWKLRNSIKWIIIIVILKIVIIFVK